LRSTRISDNNKWKVASSDRRGGGETMKRTMVICALMALVIAGSASANYLWSFNATNNVNGKFGTAYLGGVFTPVGVGDQAWTVADAAYAAEVKLATPGSPDSSAKNNLWKKNYYSPTEATKWYVEVWAGDGFVGETFDFRIWMGAVVTTAGVLPRPLSVKIAYDPVGTRDGEVLGTVGTATGGTQAAPTKKWTLAAAKSSTPMASGVGYILEMSVPEPGSIVAMLSGLVGLVGFGIRRKR
jgi:hypothetical protein